LGNTPQPPAKEICETRSLVSRVGRKIAMARRVLIRDQALADLADISDHLCKLSRSLAERFLDAADSTFADLAKNPGLGGPCQFAHPFIADIRRWRVKKFKDYLIFYAAVEDGVRIYRVLHGARDLETILAEG
jgi:toxin ParE1/3/4